MAQVSLQTPILGGNDQTEQSKVISDLQAIVAQINGNIDQSNLAAALAATLGVNTASAKRGASIITATDTIGSTSPALLGNPDRVSQLVVPTNGIIWVSYRAIFTYSAGPATTITATLYLGNNAAKNMWGGGAPSIRNPYAQPGYPGATLAMSASYASATVQAVCSTHPISGLAESGADGAGNPPQSSDLVNGQGVGPFYPIRVQPGTYDVSVRWACTNGTTVTVSDRALFAKVEQFS